MTSTLRVEIVTTLEYLGLYGQGDPFWGAIVSVGIAGDTGTIADEELAKNILRPWLWENLSFKLFALSKNALQLNDSSPVKMWSRPVRDISALVDLKNHKKGVLDNAFNSALSGGGSFPTEALRTQISDKPQHSSVDSKVQQPPWPAVLAQISQMPHPIPHVLKISNFFQAAKPTSAEFVIAIPTFTANANTFNPSGSAELVGEVAAMAVYTSSATTNVVVSSVCNRVSLPLKEPKMRGGTPTRLASDDPYVPIEQRDVYDADWLSELAVRLCEPFDLGQRLIDAVSALFRDAKPEVAPDVLRKQIPNLRNCLVLGLYDLANTGVDAGPDRGSVLRSALARLEKVDESVLDAWVRSLASYQSNIGGDLGKIRELLRTAIKEVSGCPAISESQAVPAPPVGPGQSAPKIYDETAVRTVVASELQQWEALQTAVSRDANLGALLIAQWKSAALLAGINATQRDSFVQAAGIQIQNIPLRRRFALANLAKGDQKSYWSRVTKISNLSTDERGDIVKNFQKTLHDAMGDRLAACNTEKPVTTALLGKVDEWSKAYAVQSLLPAHEVAPTADAAPTALTFDSVKSSVPHGVSLHVDSLYTFPDEKEEQSDIARQSSGFAAFMVDDRQPKAWRCLSLARVQFPDSLGNPGTAWPDPVVVPFPIQDEAGMRRCVITYNNGPISSANPVSQLGPKAKTGETGTPIVWYLNAYTGKDQWAKLPPLINGRTYRFLVSRLSNSGALPKELAKKGSPGELKAQSDFDSSFLSKSYVPQVRYLRRVPVGGLRVGAPTKDSSVSKANQKLVWGENVAGVQPRALEQLAQTGDLIARSNGNQPESIPVMLIRDKSYSFSVDRPATDIQTLDRYMAGPSDRTKLRKSVWATVHRNRSRLGEESGADTLLLEDPAVSSYLVAELVTEGSSLVKPVKAIKIARWNLKSSPLTVSDLRTPPISVSVKPAPPDAKTATFSPGEQIEIAVPPGTVAYLYLSAVVGKDEADKFYPGVVGGQILGDLMIDGKSVGEDLARSYVLPPFAMAIERVSETLPDVETLRSQLAASFTDSRLIVTLTRDTSDAFKNVGRVDILRQRWHWNGRPFGTKNFKFPANTFNPEGTENAAASEQDANERHKWLLQAFAWREDYEVLSTRLAKPLKGDASRFERSDDISSEPQGTVYRFAVRVWSRYAPLLTAVQSRDSATAHPEDLTGWKTVYVPCQSRFAPPSTGKDGAHPGETKPGQVPVPHIKLILPLTESGEGDSDARGVSGLMVVLEGPWFTVGGVTETLECEIATTTVPGSATSVQEAGYDAVRSRTIARDNYELRRLIGPIGHTFDESEALPKFVNTSFILPGPKVKTKDGKSDATDFSLFFGKIRFTRSIQPGGGQGAISSDATDPYWVQFLPRFAFQADSQEISEASSVILSPDGHSVTLRNGNKDLIIQRSADERETTRLFGILTSAISDVTGRRVQEHYTGFFRYIDSSWQSDTAITGTRSNLRFRIIEVEIPTNHGRDPISLSEFWARIFPPARSEKPDELEDSKARIFRVSRPIGSVSAEGGSR